MSIKIILLYLFKIYYILFSALLF